MKKENAPEIPVVIMAGGYGTRLKPYTEILPKPLIPVGNVPMVRCVVDSFNKFGHKDYFFVLQHNKELIKTYFSQFKHLYNINYVEETQPLGTGGGLILLKDEIKSTFVLTNCDTVINEDLNKIYQFHKKSNNKITIICANKKIDISYGVVEVLPGDMCGEIREKPTIEVVVNVGMYIVEPDVLMQIPENQFIGFPDVIKKMQKNGNKIGAFVISDECWIDMGQIDLIEELNRKNA